MNAGIRIPFDSEKNRVCKGKDPEFVHLYLAQKQRNWIWLKEELGRRVSLSEVLLDFGYDLKEVYKNHPEAQYGYWDEGSDNHLYINYSFDSEGRYLLEFNCEMEEPKKKRCYFWRIYKYHVSVDQISLSGWVEWCDELFRLQHGKPRPKNNKIFVNPDMKEAIVKARVWNKDQIEKWLNDHGYRWTYTTEVKYQYAFKNADEVELVDSDAEVMARKSA